MKNQLFNRKLLFSFMAVIMCLGFTALSYGAATVSVDPASVESPAVGEQLIININIAGGVGVAGAQVQVNYDSTALSYVSAAKGDYLPGDPAAGTFFPLLRSGDSHVVIGGTSIGAGTGEGDGTLATVTFEVVEVKASSITLSDVVISDASANPLDVTTADGAVTVPAPDPVYGVMLEGVGDLTAEVSTPAEDVTYTLKVTNTGDTDDVIDLATSNAAATLSETSVSLAAGASAEVTLTIPATALATAGDHEVKVTATSQGDNTKTAEVSTTTTVPEPATPDPVYGVMLEGVGDLTAEVSTPAEDVTYTLKVTNTGDTDDVIDLATSNAAATLSETSVSLAAGASAEVTLTIPATALATAGDHEVKVTATSQGDNTKTAEVSTTTTVPEPVDPGPTPVIPEPQVFKITLTNLTMGVPGMGGQIFSPPIFAAHPAGAKIYEVGKEANAAIVALAENGDSSGLAAIAAAAGANVVALTPPEGFVVPSTPDSPGTVTVMLEANAMNSALSFATMLVSTNDAFIGVADLPLYDDMGMPITTSLPLTSYDAGSEQNTERASDIPGPVGVDDPEDLNNRVPTEGGVITPHPGIQLVGDVTAAFAWTEPTATLTIEPYVPEPPPPPEPVLPTYDVTLAAGLNMISVPLMPEVPYTAKSLAAMLGATVVIKLDAYSQNFVGYVVMEEDDGFAIEGGKGYIVNTPEGGTVTFSGNAWSNEPPEMAMDEAAAAPKIATSSAWAFIVTSNLQEKVSGATYTMVAKNLRTGIVSTKTVTSEDGYISAVWADVSQKSVVEAGDKIEVSVLDEDGTVVSGPFQRTVQTTDIHNAYMNVEMRVGDVRPQETILGQNFPNPFNPETWIPYQLNRGSNVMIHIYDVSGHTVRTLNLGHKSTGSYMTSSSAAYWDGKNETGEQVSSGIYFYKLETKNFSATRRMVILK